MKIEGWRKFTLAVIVVLGAFVCAAKHWMDGGIAAQLIGYALTAFFTANVVKPKLQPPPIATPPGMQP